MFSCPACHRRTISLYQRIAASDPAYPATCRVCKQQSVLDQSQLGAFVWLEAPALGLTGLLWLITDDVMLASQIAVASVLLLLPGSLFFVPMRVHAQPEPCSPSLVTVSVVEPVFGPVAYVAFLLAVFIVLVGSTYVLLPFWR